VNGVDVHESAGGTHILFLGPHESVFDDNGKIVVGCDPA
jgi:hypothetical protein